MLIILILNFLIFFNNLIIIHIFLDFILLFIIDLIIRFVFLLINTRLIILDVCFNICQTVFYLQIAIIFVFDIFLFHLQLINKIWAIWLLLLLLSLNKKSFLRILLYFLLIINLILLLNNIHQILLLNFIFFNLC